MCWTVDIYLQHWSPGANFGCQQIRAVLPIPVNYTFDFHGVKRVRFTLIRHCELSSSGPCKDDHAAGLINGWRQHSPILVVIITSLHHAVSQRFRPRLVPHWWRRRRRERLSRHAFHDYQSLLYANERILQPHLSPSRYHTEYSPSQIPV